MKTVSVRKAITVMLITSVSSLVCGVVSGHATCMHQHVTACEADKSLRNKDGELSVGTYLKNIVKDYKNMQKDPLGLERLLD